MTEKDWEIYTKLAKEMDIYLLRGNAKDRVVNGCKIRFYSLRELVTQLRKKSTSETKPKIEGLIKRFYAILRGNKKPMQPTLDDYRD